ncbi:helix-turn-helix domain-containing protein [Streptomyces sp. NPDC051662]|uniref:AraC family transcriptional regulator n=1 Tax=Streptomyces sp. NPDC051662 TaxID=3154750 RepID=UPI00343BAC26
MHPARPIPLNIGIDFARHTLLRSRDEDEIVTAVSGVLRPHSLRAVDHFQVSCLLQHVTIGGISATRLRYGRRVVIESGPLHTCYLVSVPLAGTAVYQHGAQTVTAGPSTATVISPHEPFRITMGTDYDQLIVRIDRRVMERVRDARAGDHDDEPVRFKLPFHTGSAEWAAWAPAAQALLGNDQFLTQVQRSPRMGVHLEWLLASALLEAQPNTAGEPHADSGTGAASPLFVRRAEEYIHARFAEPVTVSDIADHARVSTRSLYAGFKEHRGVSPMSLVRRLRLERVRHELLTTPGGSATVTEIAFRWGFGHLGEFSAAYRQRFGETPSATLARTP